MAERAHPDDPGFQGKWKFRLRRGFIPWLTYQKRVYRDAFFWRYRWVNRYVKGKDVLDIPCGVGWGTALLQGARSVVGVDLSEEAVCEALDRYGSVARFCTGSMAKLEFQDDSFDLISCLEGIEHVSVGIGEKFLREAHRVLRPRGILLLSSPYCRDKEHSGNPYHVHEYRPAEIKSVLKECFEVQSVVERDVDDLTVMYIKCRAREICHNGA